MRVETIMIVNEIFLGNVLKKSAIVVAVAGFFGALILVNSLFKGSDTSFKVGFIFCVWIADFLLSLLLYGIGSILESINDAKESNDKQYKEIMHLLRDDKVSLPGNSIVPVISKRESSGSFDPLNQYRCICTYVNDLSNENCYHCDRPKNIVLEIQKQNR